MKQHEQYMRLTTNEEFQVMTRSELLSQATKWHVCLPSDVSDNELRDQLAQAQRTRTLALWHDHSTILLTGYILFAVWVIYDSAVFLTSQEYAQKCGKKVSDLQETIKEPVVYTIAPSTSSPSDQLALIGDRLECLSELSQTIASSNGIEIRDELWFFSGDNPAQEFERGTQIGGIFKCGGCGCRDTMMGDLVHALQCKWRSLADIQELVLAGTYGSMSGQLKPLEGLNVKQLRKELESRGSNNNRQTETTATRRINYNPIWSPKSAYCAHP